MRDNVAGLVIARICGLLEEQVLWERFPVITYMQTRKIDLCRMIAFFVIGFHRTLAGRAHPPNPRLHQVAGGRRRGYTGIAFHKVGRTHIPGIFEHSHGLAGAEPLILEKIGVKIPKIILNEQGDVFACWQGYCRIVGRFDPAGLAECIYDHILVAFGIGHTPNEWAA